MSGPSVRPSSKIKKIPPLLGVNDKIVSSGRIFDWSPCLSKSHSFLFFGRSINVCFHSFLILFKLRQVESNLVGFETQNTWSLLCCLIWFKFPALRLNCGKPVLIDVKPSYCIQCPILGYLWRQISFNLVRKYMMYGLNF